MSKIVKNTRRLFYKMSFAHARMGTGLTIFVFFFPILYIPVKWLIFRSRAKRGVNDASTHRDDADSHRRHRENNTNVTRLNPSNEEGLHADFDPVASREASAIHRTTVLSLSSDAGRSSGSQAFQPRLFFYYPPLPGHKDQCLSWGSFSLTAAGQLRIFTGFPFHFELRHEAPSRPGI